MMPGVFVADGFGRRVGLLVEAEAEGVLVGARGIGSVFAVEMDDRRERGAERNMDAAADGGDRGGA